MARKPKRVFFNRIGNTVSSATAPVKRKSKKVLSTATRQLRLRPLTAFIIFLAILLALITASNQITKPETQETPQTTVKEVRVFKTGEAPRITLNAQIQKSGVIQIVAQAPGIVSKVHVKEGQVVKKGQTLISTGSNYNGASAASVQRQLAQAQYNSAKNTFNLQKEIIGKQREIANKTDASADEIRDITNESLGETRDLISLNEDIITTVDENLKTLEDGNVGGANDDLILQTKQLKAQLQAGLNQARSGLRTAEFQQSGDKPPAQLSDLSRELAQKQLDLQEKSLSLGLETARLQLKLAQISESAMFPSAPFAGVVERVNVRVGQSVSPATPLVTISGSSTTISATAFVPRHIAQSVNKLQSSYLIIDGEKIEATPIYVSTEATNGQLYSVLFAVPEEYESKLTDLAFIDVEIPIGENFSTTAYPFIPIDSVQQTQDTAVVFTVDGEQALGKTVTLGEVQGNFVQIISGLGQTDTVILDRNIISGDKVKISSTL